MSTTPIGRRTSFLFYGETKQALTALEKDLKKAGVEADWTEIVRALVHATPENVILGLATLRDAFERSPAAAKLADGHIVPFRMNPEHFAKLERVVGKGKRVEVALTIGVLMRALATSKPPLPELAEQVRALREAYPDGRALRWQKQS
jgi:hypothetical protein